MNVSVVTLEGSLYGLRLLNELARQERPATLAIVVQDDLRRKVRLLRRAARHVSVRDAAILAVESRLAESRARRRREWRGSPLAVEYETLAEQVVRTRSLASPEPAEAVRDRQIDLVLLGRSGIVPAGFLELPKLGTLNAHPGWLPDYRGLDSAVWAVIDGRFDRVGSTLHLVDAGIDTGPIVARRSYRWNGEETIDGLEERLYDNCIDLMMEGERAAAAGALGGELQVGGAYLGLATRRQRASAQRSLAAFLAGRPA